jgi:hypothetical protein
VTFPRAARIETAVTHSSVVIVVMPLGEPGPEHVFLVDATMDSLEPVSAETINSDIINAGIAIHA